MPTKEKDQDILRECRERFKLSSDAEAEERIAALEDMRFLAGEQWPDEIRSMREREGRPCLTVNRLPGFVDQVVGDARQNKMSILVRPQDSNSDPAVAELLTGLIKNIEGNSDADIAYDTALEGAASCGRGAFRILTQFVDDDAFDQEIRIKTIENPFTVYFDPAAKEYDRSDARYCIVTEKISKDDFKQAYPDASMSGYAESGTADDWCSDDDTVRIAEYWRKVPVRKEIVLLSTGEVVDAGKWAKVADELAAMPEPVTEVRRRTVDTHRVEWYLVSGAEVLEQREWAGKYIPVVPVWGKQIMVDGERHLRGIVRFAAEPQRLYNYERSAFTEAVALAPKAPWIVDMATIAPFLEIWNNAHNSIYPFLPVDTSGGGEREPGTFPLPQRSQQGTFPSGYGENAQVAVDEMKATTGIYDASLGAQSNETSGKAILARQKEGDVANFAFHDNMRRSLRYAGRILVDLIPKIYDTERIVRVTGEDGTEEMAAINRVVWDDESGQWVKLNDLSMGRYDVAVDIGPSYSTRRVESANAMIDFARVVPQFGMVIGPRLAKLMDWPGADEIAEDLQKLLPPQLTVDPNASPQPPQLSPADMAKADRDAAQAEKLRAETAKIASEIPGVVASQDKTSAEAYSQHLQNAADAHAMQMHLQEMAMEVIRRGLASMAAQGLAQHGPLITGGY